MKVQDRGSGKDKASGLNDSPNKNHFYALRPKDHTKTSYNIVICMPNVFPIDVYVLHCRGSTFSFFYSLDSYEVLEFTRHSKLTSHSNYPGR